MYTHNPEASGETTKVCERVKFSQVSTIYLYMLLNQEHVLYTCMSGRLPCMQTM